MIPASVAFSNGLTGMSSARAAVFDLALNLAI